MVWAGLSGHGIGMVWVGVVWAWFECTGMVSAWFWFEWAWYGHGLSGHGMRVTWFKWISSRFCFYLVPDLLVISNDTSALVGNSALLACVGIGVPSVEITWSLNGASITNSSIVTISEEEITRGETVFKQSFLELCSLSISNSGVYACSVSNGGQTMVNDTTQLYVTGKQLHGDIDCLYPNLHSLEMSQNYDYSYS